MDQVLLQETIGEQGGGVGLGCLIFSISSQSSCCFFEFSGSFGFHFYFVVPSCLASKLLQGKQRNEFNVVSYWHGFVSGKSGTGDYCLSSARLVKRLNHFCAIFEFVQTGNWFFREVFVFMHLCIYVLVHVGKLSVVKGFKPISGQERESFIAVWVFINKTILIILVLVFGLLIRIRYLRLRGFL